MKKKFNISYQVERKARFYFPGRFFIIICIFIFYTYMLPVFDTCVTRPVPAAHIVVSGVRGRPPRAARAACSGAGP